MGNRLGVTALLCMAGCSGSAALAPGLMERTPSGFPTPEAISKVTEVSLPSADEAFVQRDVARWQLVGPLPAGIPQPAVAVTPVTPWERIAAQALERRQGSLQTPAMRCVARELGRFYLEHGAYPSSSIQAFVLARCGSTATQLRLFTYQGEVAPEIGDAEILEQWEGSLTNAIQAVPDQRNLSFGVWFGRKADRTLFFVASGERLVTLDAVTRPGGEARFVLSGALLTETGQYRALVNRGRFGVSACVPGAEALPRFTVDCPISVDDEYAWIELGAFPPGRILGRTVLNVLVWPSGKMGDTYVRAGEADDTPITSIDDITLKLVPAINGLRARAGLSALSLEPAQSARARKLAPHYFAAIMGILPPELAETIVLGLRAGWEVRGDVQHGNLTAAIGLGATTVGTMLGSAAERPFGREVLFDPLARRIAVGPLSNDEPEFHGAVLATYAVFEMDPSMDLATEVFERIRLRRQQALRGPPERFELGDLPSRIASDVSARKVDPAGAMKLLNAGAVAYSKSSVRTWVIEARELEMMQLPDELLKRDQLTIAVGVGHYRPDGEPWARYVILLVVKEPSTTAQLNPLIEPSLALR